jgi:UDP-N-acetylglucosamine--N-acetylmuramyl-(pentapeptide) pyrophosphoryl-undecaprenol N-acetylglucosamine transferase
VLLPERELTPQRLAAEIERFAFDRAALCRMAERARQLSRPDATEELAKAALAAGGIAA